MATKITGYKVSLSTGGNTCVQCGTRMRKGLPYLAPVRGKRVIHELVGKSICVSCIKELMERTDQELEGKEQSLDYYEKKRFTDLI
jgi:hypothetical protein